MLVAPTSRQGSGDPRPGWHRVQGFFFACKRARSVLQLTRLLLPLLPARQVLGTPTREEIHAMNPNYTEFKFPQVLQWGGARVGGLLMGGVGRGWARLLRRLGFRLLGAVWSGWLRGWQWSGGDISCKC